MVGRKRETERKLTWRGISGPGPACPTDRTSRTWYGSNRRHPVVSGRGSPKRLHEGVDSIVSPNANIASKVALQRHTAAASGAEAKTRLGPDRRVGLLRARTQHTAHAFCETTWWSARESPVPVVDWEGGGTVVAKWFESYPTGNPAHPSRRTAAAGKWSRAAGWRQAR